MDVYKAGGGIKFTVKETRAASQARLEELLEQRLTRMLRCGTTVAEVKSGTTTGLASFPHPSCTALLITHTPQHCQAMAWMQKTK